MRQDSINWNWMRTVLSLLLLGANCSAQQDSFSDAAIARAGKMFISEKEFMERFELLPAFGRHRASQLETAKLELLYSIIAEKLLAQEAVAWGIDRRQDVQRAVRETEKLLARDELYREEIVGAVSVAPQEIEQAMERAQRQLVVEYAFFERKEDALFVRSRMELGSDFDRLLIDSSFHAIRDTATLVWGEADPAIEEAAYRLARDSVSPVVAAGTGFYILRVASVEPNAFYTGMPADVLRERVATSLRRRKERERLDRYMETILQDKTGYARPRPMHTLAAAFDDALNRAARDSVFYLTPANARFVKSKCGHSLGDTLAVAGTTFWTTGDVVDLLTGKSFAVRDGGEGSIASRLVTEVEVIVQQELMAQEALRLHLNEVPEVHRQVEMWRQYFLAGGVKDSLERAVRVSDAEIWSDLKSRDSAAPVPQVQVRELKTRSIGEMQAALDELRHGASFAEAVARWSEDTVARRNGGLTGFFPVTANSPVGEIAGSLHVGDRYGPIQAGGKEIYFEVVAKKTAPLGRDSLLSERFVRARDEVAGRKYRRTLTLLLSGLGKEMGFDIYTDRLKMLKVSPVPMMTYRILGFGGRMPAVPFVAPQLQWLDADSGRGESLP